MALIKRKKGESVEQKPAAPSSNLYRHRDNAEGQSFAPMHPTQLERDDEEPEPEPEPPFEQTLVSPPRVESTGRVIGGKPRVETKPSTLNPLTQTLIVGGDRPPAPPQPDPIELEFDDEDLEEPEEEVQKGPPIDEQILEQARMKAQQMLQEAQAQAQHYMQQTATQAQQAAQQAEEQARERGYQEGLQAGHQQGYNASVGEFVERIAQAKDMYVQAVRARRAIVATVEPELARLAVKIAERVLGEAIKVDPEVILAIVRQALGAIKDREEVSIRVNPQDVQIVRDHRASFERMVEGLKSFEVVADPTIDPGGCTIETNLGNIDARLHTQLDAIRHGMEEMAKLREEELANQAATEPVEVPGDPDFQGLEEVTPQEPDFAPEEEFTPEPEFEAEPEFSQEEENG
ncbi:MAG: FliH/SctL family protein [Vulcanimicrobiota bacterium]